MSDTTLRTIEPKILYFGTPVALISSLNEDGETNLAPISPFSDVGWTVSAGLLDETRDSDKQSAGPECAWLICMLCPVGTREEFEPLKGKDPVPELKTKQFHFEPEKFDAARSRRLAAKLVKAARAEECPVPVGSASASDARDGRDGLEELGGGVAAEVEVVRVHVASNLVIEDRYIDVESGRRSFTTSGIITGWRRRNWGRRFERRSEASMLRVVNRRPATRTDLVSV